MEAAFKHFGIAALRAVAGYQEEGVRKALAEYRRLFGVRRADDGANGGLPVFPDGALAPTLYHIAHALVHGAPVGEL